ncbi:MAG TPA: hypothetical protein VIX86_09880 [Streptosporangiaceae bacterium]
MATYLPPGWPTGVHPPGSQDFERTAVAWLLDVVPPDYRLYGVLRRHPAALASLARHHLAACVEGARQGYRTARTELGGAVPPHGLDAVLAVYRSEGRRLVATANAVGLVERALRGETFTPRLRDRPGKGPADPEPATGARPMPSNGRAASMTATNGRATGNGIAADIGRAAANGMGADPGRVVSNGSVTSNGSAGNSSRAGNGSAGQGTADSGTAAASKTTAGKAAGPGKAAGAAKSASSGKSAGQGKPARNGKTVSSRKGRQLATAGDGS